VAAAVSRIDLAPTAAIAEEFRSPGNSTGARRATSAVAETTVAKILRRNPSSLFS